MACAFSVVLKAIIIVIETFRGEESFSQSRFLKFEELLA